MNQRLTSPELRLAAWLPCTAAAVAEGYSRVWRMPPQRWQSVTLAVLVLGALGVLLWLLPPARMSSGRWNIPDGARVWLGLLALLAGIGSGFHARRQIARTLDAHWLAWCLTARQICMETIVRGLWRAEAATLKLLLMCLLAAHWFALSVRDAASAAELFAGGYALAFVAARGFFRTGVAAASGKPAAIRRWPAFLCLHTARPGRWLAGTGLAALAVAAIGAQAAHTAAPQLLTVAAIVAASGCVFTQIRLDPGTAALQRLLAWTGVSVWWGLARVLWVPVGACVLLVAPVGIAALMLDRPLWALAASVGVLASGWVALLRALGDLVRMRRGRADAFVLIHSLIPPVLLMSLTPAESLPLLGLHLGWLLWQVRRLWNPRA